VVAAPMLTNDCARLVGPWGRLTGLDPRLISAVLISSPQSGQSDPSAGPAADARHRCLSSKCSTVRTAAA